MKKKVLVVVDMQNDFITGSLGNEHAKNVVLPNIINKIKAKNYNKIIFTQDTHDNEYLENTLEGKMLPIQHCIKSTKGWELAKELENELDVNAHKILNSDIPYCCVEKNTFGSYVVSYLTKFNNEDPDEIEICGLCTDICVITNALLLRTEYPNAKIVCDSSCCGGTSKEAHDSAIKVMRSCQIEID